MLRMPLAKLHQYAHCSLLWAGVNTRWRYEMPGEADALRAAIARLKARRKSLKV